MQILPGQHDFDENGSSDETDDCDDNDGDYDEEDYDDGSPRPD